MFLFAQNFYLEFNKRNKWTSFSGQDGVAWSSLILVLRSRDAEQNTKKWRWINYCEKQKHGWISQTKCQAKRTRCKICTILYLNNTNHTHTHTHTHHNIYVCVICIIQIYIHIHIRYMWVYIYIWILNIYIGKIYVSIYNSTCWFWRFG